MRETTITRATPEKQAPKTRSGGTLSTRLDFLVDSFSRVSESLSGNGVVTSQHNRTSGAHLVKSWRRANTYKALRHVHAARW